MANLTNEQREDAAVTAALAAGNSPPKAYETLVAPYPVWSAIHACGVPRTGEKHCRCKLLHNWILSSSDRVFSPLDKGSNIVPMLNLKFDLPMRCR